MMRKIYVSVIFGFLLVCVCIVPAFASVTNGYYIGSGYIVANTSELGNGAEIFVPIDSKGKWGTTSTGYLCNVSSSTISGIVYSSNGTQYSFRCTSFATPEYRPNTGSYTWYPLTVTVLDSNLDVATEFPVAKTFTDMYPLIIVGLFGVVIVCLMRSKR